MSVNNKKWNTDNIPDGYPKKFDTNLLEVAIQDLNDEYISKKKNGKVNKIWEDIILQQINSGNEELKQRKQIDEAKTFFSMNNPWVYISVTVMLALVAYLAYKLGLPLRFGSD